jgi:hypothetical protein
MRTIFYDSAGAALIGADNTQLIDQWTFTLVGMDEPSACAALTVEYNSQCGDYITSSNDAGEYSLTIPHALETIAELEGCEAVYKVYIKDPSGTWKSWDAVIEAFMTVIPAARIKIDMSTSDIMMKFTEEELKYIKSLYNIDSETVLIIDVKVVALVPGSGIAGAITDIDSLVSA